MPPSGFGTHDPGYAMRPGTRARVARRLVCVAAVSLASAAIVPAASAATVTPPGAPDLYAAFAGPADGQILLRWRAPTSSGLAPIQAYEVTRSVDGGHTWSAPSATNATARVANSIDTPALACPNTAPGSAGCEYRVAARNSAGVGPPSTVATLWTAPTVPLSLGGHATDRTYTQIRLRWLPPKNTGGRPISYEVESSMDGAADQLAAATGDTTTLVPCSGAKTCAYRVRATNSQGSSPLTVAVTLATAPGTVGNPKIAITRSDPASGRTSIVLSWLTTFAGMAPVGYQLEQCSIPAGRTTGCAATSATWSQPAAVALPAADPATAAASCRAGVSTCVFRVRALNTRGGAGLWRTFGIEPWAPFDVRVHPTKNGVDTVSFNGPAESGAGATAAKHYVLFYCGGRCSSTSNWRTSKMTIPFVPAAKPPFVTGAFHCTHTIHDQCEMRMQFVDGQGHPSALTGIAFSLPPH